MRKNVSTKEQLNISTGYPERLQNLHHWRFSRFAGRKCWATRSKLKCWSCFEQEDRLGDLSRSIPTWMIMWFYGFNQIVSLPSFASFAIPAPLSVWKMRNKYCVQVIFPHPHCSIVYPHPKNIITTYGNEKVGS